MCYHVSADTKIMYLKPVVVITNKCYTDNSSKYTHKHKLYTANIKEKLIFSLSRTHLIKII